MNPHVVAEIVRSKGERTTRFGRTIYPDTRPITVPEPDASCGLYANDAERFQPMSRGMTTFAQQDRESKKLRESVRLDRRRYNSARVEETYMREKEEVASRTATSFVFVPFLCLFIQCDDNVFGLFSSEGFEG